MPTEQAADLKALVADMNAGKVKWLVMLGVNPLYNAPADLEFADGVRQGAEHGAPGLASSMRRASISTWHINKAHYLESWSDARAYDGTISIIQPMIEPLYGGKSAHDVLQALLDPPQSSRYDVVAGECEDLHQGRLRCGLAEGAARWLG